MIPGARPEPTTHVHRNGGADALLPGDRRLLLALDMFSEREPAPRPHVNDEPPPWPDDEPWCDL